MNFRLMFCTTFFSLFVATSFARAQNLYSETFTHSSQLNLWGSTPPEDLSTGQYSWKPNSKVNTESFNLGVNASYSHSISTNFIESIQDPPPPPGSGLPITFTHVQKANAVITATGNMVRDGWAVKLDAEVTIDVSGDTTGKAMYGGSATNTYVTADYDMKDKVKVNLNGSVFGPNQTFLYLKYRIHSEFDSSGDYFLESAIELNGHLFTTPLGSLDVVATSELYIGGSNNAATFNNKWSIGLANSYVLGSPDSLLGRYRGSKTFELETILFADGTTPESHGFTLEFDSGRTSPNIAAVPEPTTCTLAALGLLGVRWRRRKRA